VIIWMMLVHWRERYWSLLREEVTNEELEVHNTLAACGLLKFFECRLVRAQEYLLKLLIQMWSLDLHCFMVWGEKLAFIAVEDIYFLIGLPFRGSSLSAEPIVPGDGKLVVLGQRYCTRENFMSGSVVKYWGNGFPCSSLRGNDDCESLWVSCDSANQWRSAEDYGGGTGR
jgi:hypothetical protein